MNENNDEGSKNTQCCAQIQKRGSTLKRDLGRNCVQYSMTKKTSVLLGSELGAALKETN